MTARQKTITYASRAYGNLTVCLRRNYFRAFALLGLEVQCYRCFDMASSESRKNNREAEFVWAFVTVQKQQENGEWKDAEPGHAGSAKDRCTCLFCGKQFGKQLHMSVV